MTPRSYTSEGIVLTRKKYSEADRILSIFSKHFGKNYFLAKGVRKPKSRKRGHIEVFSYVRYSATRGKGMDILTEVEAIDSFELVRKDLRKIAVAYNLVEIIDKITQVEEKNTELFNLLLVNLGTLKEGKNLKKLRQNFIYEVITLLGFWPKGKLQENYEKILEDILEKKLGSSRVGKAILS